MFGVCRMFSNIFYFIKIFQRNMSHTHFLSNLLDILEEKLMIRQLKSIS